MIKLGEKVKDSITEFEGIAWAKTTYLYGCNRIGIQAKVGQDGKVPQLEWFDEPQLEGILPEKLKEDENGGPRADPTLKIDPIK